MLLLFDPVALTEGCSPPALEAFKAVLIFFEGVGIAYLMFQAGRVEKRLNRSGD